MPPKPWQSVVTPREDLISGQPLDASEFAVHLDQVRDGRARDDYQNPRMFFERNYWTKSQTTLAADVIRRLSGEGVGTSPVFNLVTQFGGGKTHALTLLYHLAEHGRASHAWRGVRNLLEAARVEEVPKAAWAIFVGTEFDSLSGRGGDDGTPLRKTPWGEIAYQLGGEAGFRSVAQHDEKGVAPAGDVIRKVLPADRPCLVLMDELMKYISAARGSGLSAQFYDFIHNLLGVAAEKPGVVVAISLPASELEMSVDDQADYTRFKKLVERLGKGMIMAADSETAEIIRRRLFEWQDVPPEGRKTAREYAAWVTDHRQYLPQWFPVDNACEAFEETYPFHPALLSVFERKWAALPRFQRTRGILRLLALWIARVYDDKRARQDALIDLGSAPLDDPDFRTAVLEQLGADDRLQAAVTTDICGKPDAHAVRLDEEAVSSIKKARLHRRVATAIFFESNGGQSKHHATEAEVRLAVSAPDLDLANVETVLNALTPPDGACYYLHAARNQYWFHTQPTLTKVLADRMAMPRDELVEECVLKEVQAVFAVGGALTPRFFPEKSSDVPDRAVFTMAVLPPGRSLAEGEATRRFVEQLTREYGTSDRTFKSALIWCVPEDGAGMNHEARKLLAWGEIKEQAADLQLDTEQRKQVDESIKKAQRDLRDSVWRAYRYVMLLDKDNRLVQLDLGRVSPSASPNIVRLVLDQLRQEAYLENQVSPRFLLRHWPPAHEEWPTRDVRDAFFASPRLARLLNGDVIKDTIADGVEKGLLAYVGKRPDGTYDPFLFERTVLPAEIELSDDVFIITAERARRFVDPPALTSVTVVPAHVELQPGARQAFTAKGADQNGAEMRLEEVTWTANGGDISPDGVFQAGPDEGSFVVTASAEGVSGHATVTARRRVGRPGPVSTGFAWKGEIPSQKWVTFYTKVLSRFANDAGLRITVEFEVTGEGTPTQHAAEETRAAMRELGLEVTDEGV